VINQQCHALSSGKRVAHVAQDMVNEFAICSCRVPEKAMHAALLVIRTIR
jgi:hypothetical protein